MRPDVLWSLVLVFVPFSLASVGGGLAVISGIQHQSVDVQGWLTTREFVEIFAIARAAPGPGSMIVTLIGWKAASWPGAIVATLAMYVPSSLLLYGAARAWDRFRGRPWHTALEQGLAPVGAGLMLAGLLSVLRILGGGVWSWGVAAGSGAVLVLRPKLNPLILLGIGALIFAFVHGPQT